MGFCRTELSKNWRTSYCVLLENFKIKHVKLYFKLQLLTLYLVSVYKVRSLGYNVQEQGLRNTQNQGVDFCQ